MNDPPSKTNSIGTNNIGQSGYNLTDQNHNQHEHLMSQTVAHSGSNSLVSALAIPCPQFQSNTNTNTNTVAPVVSFGQHNFKNVSTYSSPTSSLSPSHVAQNRGQDISLNNFITHKQQLLSMTQTIFPKTDAPVQTKLFPNIFDNNDTISSTHDEPLDLSFKSKSYSSACSSVADDSMEAEALNLSLKSSRNSQDNKDAVQPNVSLTMLQNEIDVDNIRNVLINNNADFVKAYSKATGSIIDNGIGSPRSSRGRKRLMPEAEMNNSNDSNNNIIRNNNEFEMKHKNTRLQSLSPKKESKQINNGSLSSQNSPDHNQSEGSFTCDQCDKTFSKQSSLARHKYEHSGI